jgi:4-aminobutyrate aminotransferase
VSTNSHLAPVWFSVTGLPVVSGSGSFVTTEDGVEYLDFSAGIAVVSTGHSHPKVVAAIAEQAAKFIHAQVNVYRHNLLEPLATRLNDLTPDSIDTFFFANSGAEATEGAVKLAKQVSKRPNVIVFSGSFHGRTAMTMAMTTSKTGYRSGHQPLPSGVFVAPFCGPKGDPAAALAALEFLFKSQTAPAETAAVVIEPVLGEGGYLPAHPDFLRGVVEICRRNDVLFVADEVQTGFARTGKMFAIEHYDITPDIIIMAKGIASGFPLSAIGASRELMDRWPVGSHGGTYGGNPIGCAAALATIEVITADGFIDNVVARGAQLTAGLEVLASEHADLVDVRGYGLMIGCQFADPGRIPGILAHALNEGHTILMNAGTNNDVIRWMPPLTVNAEEIELGLAAFANALKATA